MQPHKRTNCQDYSLFAEHQLGQELMMPQNEKNNHKSMLPLSNHKEFSQLLPDSLNRISNRDSSQFKFYQQYKKIYTVSHHLSIEKMRQAMLMDSLMKRIQLLEDKMNQEKINDYGKKGLLSEENRTKRSRRTAQEIQKKFKCEVAYCERLYGSEASLQQHTKLKHPQIYQMSHNEGSNLLNYDSNL